MLSPVPPASHDDNSYNDYDDPNVNTAGSCCEYRKVNHRPMYRLYSLLRELDKCLQVMKKLYVTKI